MYSLIAFNQGMGKVFIVFIGIIIKGGIFRSLPVSD